MDTTNRTLVARPESGGRTGLVLVVALAALAALAVVLALPGLGNAAAAKGTVVTTAQNTLGKILVDSRGRTLYLFEKDPRGKSACTGSCAVYWPPLLTAAKPVGTAGVKLALLGTTKRADGKLQVTYAGHPLYTYVQDAKRGQTKGQGLDVSGGEWYVLGTTGAKIEKPKASGGTTMPTTTTDTSGGGYDAGY